jgi:hypothetical protein
MYVYVYIYICICICICMYMYVYVCVHLHGYMYVEMYVCVCICLLICMYMYIDMDMCMYTRMYASISVHNSAFASQSLQNIRHITRISTHACTHAHKGWDRFCIGADSFEFAFTCKHTVGHTITHRSHGRPVGLLARKCRDIHSNSRHSFGLLLP